MLRLFEDNKFPNEGVSIPSNQRYLKTKANELIDVLEKYYARSSYRLPNQHLLIQILKNLEYSLETPFEKVVETTQARSLYVARHFNLISELDFGKPHKGVFYSHKDSDCVDYVFIKNFVDVNPFDEEKNWINVSPLKVLTHPVTDFNFMLIDGQPRSDLGGYSVVQLDICLLSFQYREFCLEMLRSFKDDAIYNPNKFIVTRVLPKLFKSHLDYLLFNQFLLKEKMITATESYKKLPFVLPPLETITKQMTSEVSNNIKKSKKSYSNELASIPSCFLKNGLESLRLPETISTRSSYWLKLLSRMSAIEYLLESQGKTGRNNNRSLLNEFKRDLGYFLNSKGQTYFNNKTLEENFLTKAKKILDY